MSVPPPTSTLRSMLREKHMARLKEIIATLHPEKVEMLVDDKSVCKNATKKALQCLFGYDNCLVGRIGVARETNGAPAPAFCPLSSSSSSTTACSSSSSVSEKSMWQRDKESCQKAVEKEQELVQQPLSWKESEKHRKEAKERELEQSLQQAEDELLQQALLASLEDIPMIERAHALVQRAASEARRVRIEQEMQEAYANLLEHMIGALPLLAGLVSKETRLAMTNCAVPQYEPVYGLLRREQQARYREFVKFYMSKWMSEQTWHGYLQKEHIDTVVEQVESALNAQTTPVLGWCL